MPLRRMVIRPRAPAAAACLVLPHQACALRAIGSRTHIDPGAGLQYSFDRFDVLTPLMEVFS
jgi:hypothetical protein